MTKARGDYSKACNELPKLEIQATTTLEEKVAKLTTDFKDTNAKVDEVRIEMEMKIFELQLQLQLDTPLDIREQHTVELKSVTQHVYSHIQQCAHISGEFIDVQTSLQEDSQVQKLQAKVHEKKEQLDLIKVTTKNLTPMQ